MEITYRPETLGVTDYQFFPADTPPLDVDLVDWMSDDMSVFDIVLRDLGYELMAQKRENVAAIHVVDRSGIPAAVASPPYPLDACFEDVAGNLHFLNHMTSKSSKPLWYAELPESILRILVQVRAKMHAALPVVKVCDLPAQPMMVDWIYRAPGGLAMRAEIQAPSESGSQVRWVRFMILGHLANNCPQPPAWTSSVEEKEEDGASCVVVNWLEQTEPTLVITAGQKKVDP